MSDLKVEVIQNFFQFQDNLKIQDLAHTNHHFQIKPLLIKIPTVKCSHQMNNINHSTWIDHVKSRKTIQKIPKIKCLQVVNIHNRIESILKFPSNSPIKIPIEKNQSDGILNGVNQHLKLEDKSMMNFLRFQQT